MDQSIVTRVKPNSLEAEQSVIGALIMDSSGVDDAAGIITRDDFYYNDYGVLFEAICTLKEKGRPVDITTIVDQLDSMSAPPTVKDGGFIRDLADSVPLAGNVETYARIVKERSLLRQIIDNSREIEERCYEGSESVEDILEATERNYLSLLAAKGIGDNVPINEIVNKALERIREAYYNKGGLTGLSTGFDDLDRMTAGLQKSDLILVAARPSMGKTAFALNIANHVVLRDNLPVAIFSLEMSPESLTNRLFSIDAAIESEKLRSGELEDMDWPKLMETSDAIAKSNLIIDEGIDMTLSELRSRCRKYKQQKDIQLVIIDYLQLIVPGGRVESQQQATAAISRALKGIARELDIPVIAISQLNRGPESREDKRPNLSDLRDSGAIEQDADVVMLLYRDDYYNKDSPDQGISEVIIAKQRNGPTGTIQLAWLGRYTKFANREKPRHNMNYD